MHNEELPEPMNGLLQRRQASLALLRRENAKADINGVKENVEYIFSIDVLLLLARVAPRAEYFRGPSL